MTIAATAAPPALGRSAYAKLAEKVAEKDRDPKLGKIAQDFEAMFLENAFGQMFSGLQGEGPLGAQGQGAEIYRGMLVQEYSKTVAARGGVGVADSVYRELIRLQERAGGASAGLAARKALAATQASASSEAAQKGRSHHGL